MTILIQKSSFFSQLDNKIKQKLARFTLLGSRVDPRVEKSRPDPTRRFWSIDPTPGRVGSGKPESGRPVYQYGHQSPVTGWFYRDESSAQGTVLSVFTDICFEPNFLTMNWHLNNWAVRILESSNVWPMAKSWSLDLVGILESGVRILKSSNGLANGQWQYYLAT